MNKILFDARKAMGKTQQQIAEMMGVDRTYYCDIENGKRTPSLRTAAKVARVFGMSIEEIFFPKQVA